MPIPGNRKRGMVWAVQSTSSVGIFFSIFRGIEIQGFVETSVSAEMLFWHFQALCSLHGCLLRNGMVEKINYLTFSSLYGIVQLPCMTSGWGFLCLAQIPPWRSPSGIKRGPQSKIGADIRIGFSASLLTRGCVFRNFFLHILKSYLFLTLPSTSWMYSGTKKAVAWIVQTNLPFLENSSNKGLTLPYRRVRHWTTWCCYC